jgi:hypothetical protein
VHLRAGDALLRKGSHLGVQVVAHEIEFVDIILIGWVECRFRGRQAKDQPAMTRIHGLESEDVAKKSAVGLGVLAVDNHMSAGNHLPLTKKCRSPESVIKDQIGTLLYFRRKRKPSRTGRVSLGADIFRRFGTHAHA